MSEDFPSSNPFRRKLSATSASTARHGPSDDAHLSSTFSNTTHPKDPEQVKPPVKTTKRVRVQSPHPSSPEDISILHQPPSSISRHDKPPATADDPFDSSISDTSDGSDDDTTTIKSNFIPSNPFQKTLATLEHTEDRRAHTAPLSTNTSGSAVGRASLDVDAFKRLLMTGSAGTLAGTPANVTTAPKTSNTGSPSLHFSHGTLNDGTSTDTSSASKQSIFEPIHELHIDSPRTSHEISDLDDDRGGFGADSLSLKTDRKKPPPPSSRHGKLIKIELRDDRSSTGFDSPTLLGARMSQQSLNSPGSFHSQTSLTDLNKPLPAAPRVSHESDRESIFDVEAAGKRPEPPSPSSSLRKKTPPAPPLSRRHSQLVADSKAYTASTGRLSPKFEEDSDYASSNPRPQPRVPPPPPTRRPSSIKNVSHDMQIPSPGIHSPELEKPAKSPAPIPPPTRISTTRQSSGRPPSVSSMELSSKRLSAAPPPPPPRQRASSRASSEVALSPVAPKSTGDYFQRSIVDTRRESQTSQLDAAEHVPTTKISAAGASDILADLAALKKEVDALRGAQESENST